MFPINASGHGGEKRSAQIFALLQPLTPQLYGDIRLPAAAQRNSLRNFKNFTAFLHWLRRNNFPVKWSADYVKKLYTAFRMMSFLRPALVIVESSNLSDSYIVDAAKYCKAFVCVVPHNVEALVPTQSSPFTKRLSPHWLNEEMNFLRKADAVYAISKYDHWLYACNQVSTQLLPYCPVTPTILALSKIREQRAKICDSRLVVILGTVKNQPTREGLRQVIDFIEQSAQTFLDFVLVGYDVEKYFPATSYQKVRIAGAATTHELDHLLSTCKCVLINHQPSSGALTRVTECLLAGVPVIGNFFAVKEVLDRPGVYLYQDFSEIDDILSQTLVMPVQEVDHAAENSFLHDLQAVLHTSP